MKLVKQVVRQPQRGFTPAVAEGEIVHVEWDGDTVVITWLVQ